ncbi:MAG TPA: hypothetical protein PLG25_14600, partial [bacterium]|nr:hypothetical protein [bacterium]
LKIFISDFIKPFQGLLETAFLLPPANAFDNLRVNGYIGNRNEKKSTSYSTDQSVHLRLCGV